MKTIKRVALVVTVVMLSATLAQAQDNKEKKEKQTKWVQIIKDIKKDLGNTIVMMAGKVNKGGDDKTPIPKPPIK